MYRTFKYFLTSLLCLAVLSCNKQSLPVNDGGEDGNIIQLTVNVSQEDTYAQTKTQLDMQNSILKVNWTSGDILYVAGESDGYLGYVTLKEKSGNQATFAGAFRYENLQKIRLIYFGKGGIDAGYQDTEYSFDWTMQDGSLESLADNCHVMTGITDEPLPMEMDQQFVDVTLHNIMSVARFNLTTQSAFDSERSVVCKGAYSKGKLNLKTGQFVIEPENDKADITLSDISDDYYIAMLPSTDPQTLTFTQEQTVAGVHGSIDIEMNPNTIDANKLYTLNGSGPAINVINALKLVPHGVDEKYSFDFNIESCPSITIQYSIDGGTEWIDIREDSGYITGRQGQTTYFRGINKSGFSISNLNYAQLKCYAIDNTTLTIEGNIMALVDWQHFNTEIPSEYYFYKLFKDAEIVSGPALPATTLKAHCYESMYEDNDVIEESPALPVGSVPDYAYANMFRNCTALKTVNDISIVNAGESAMAGMFAMNDQYSENLLTATPELQHLESCDKDACKQMFKYRTNLADAGDLFSDEQNIDIKDAYSCFEEMFAECTGLLNTCKFPFEQVAKSCCMQMFYNCTSLEDVSAFSKYDFLEEACYQQMFYNCISIENPPALPSTTLAKDCYRAMFQNCSSITVAPVLNAYSLPSGCYYDMFNWCGSLSEVKMMAQTMASGTTQNDVFGGWLDATHSPGVFYYNSATNISMWNAVVPSGWSKIPVEL